VLTSWEYHSQPADRPAQVTDHRPLLDQAGFDVLSYEETRAWRDRQQRTGQALLAQRARITEMNASMAMITRPVLVTAERRAGRGA
jgi:hypothetical protein